MNTLGQTSSQFRLLQQNVERLNQRSKYENTEREQERLQAIKVWDPRAKGIVDELATGNNAVISMGWDAPRSTLFAATERTRTDASGSHHGISTCQDPRRYEAPGVRANFGSDQQGKYEPGEDERCWPVDASHLETDFGYAFDARTFCLMHHKFGLGANPETVPELEYGRAMPSRWSARGSEVVYCYTLLGAEFCLALPENGLLENVVSSSAR